MKITTKPYIIWSIIIAGLLCQSFRPANYELPLTPRIDTIGHYGHWTVIEDTIPQPTPSKKRILNIRLPKITLPKIELSKYAPPKRMDRGIVFHTFIPKGKWLAGVNVSYYEESNKDYRFLILKDWQGSVYSLNVSPFACYFVKDNLGIGARFTYRKSDITIDNLNLSLGDDLSLGIKDYKLKDDAYLTTVFLRSYIGLDEKKRFGLFNETHLTVGTGKSYILSGKNEMLKNTYQRTTELQLGIQPGLGAFITNEMHIEASIGVAGLNYKHIRQITNGEEKGTMTYSGMDFKLNILNIRLGIVVCL